MMLNVQEYKLIQQLAARIYKLTNEDLNHGPAVMELEAQGAMRFRLADMFGRGSREGRVEWIIIP